MPCAPNATGEGNSLGVQFFMEAKYDAGGVLRFWKAFMARPLNMEMDRPAGQPMAFWLAVITPSRSQPSKSISSQATLQTPSTMMSVSGETLRTRADRFCSSLSTPVEVSTWVTVTAL